MSNEANTQTKPPYFTLEELDQFGTTTTLPFAFDHPIWQDRDSEECKRMLEAMKERRHG